MEFLMKRNLSLLFATAIFCSLFAACSSEPDADADPNQKYLDAIQGSWEGVDQCNVALGDYSINSYSFNGADCFYKSDINSTTVSKSTVKIDADTIAFIFPDKTDTMKYSVTDVCLTLIDNTTEFRYYRENKSYLGAWTLKTRESIGTCTFTNDNKLETSFTGLSDDDIVSYEFTYTYDSAKNVLNFISFECGPDDKNPPFLDYTILYVNRNAGLLYLKYYYDDFHYEILHFGI